MDDLEAIHEVCATYAIWMHVDAAYRGVLHYHLQVNEYYMAYLTLTLLLFVPYGVGALLICERSTLQRARSADCACIYNAVEESTQPDDVLNMGRN